MLMYFKGQTGKQNCLGIYSKVVIKSNIPVNARTQTFPAKPLTNLSGVLHFVISGRNVITNLRSEGLTCASFQFDLVQVINSLPKFMAVLIACCDHLALGGCLIFQTPKLTDVNCFT